jgi:hypothetical protein
MVSNAVDPVATASDVPMIRRKFEAYHRYVALGRWAFARWVTYLGVALVLYTQEKKIAEWTGLPSWPWWVASFVFFLLWSSNLEGGIRTIATDQLWDAYYTGFDEGWAYGVKRALGRSDAEDQRLRESIRELDREAIEESDFDPD